MTWRAALWTVLTGSLVVACGGGSDGKDNTAENGTTSVPSTCEPTGDIPCYEGKAEPCEGFQTQFAGDEYCLKPPDDGFQIHVGPTDYDNPDDYNRWLLAAGAGDVNWCYQMDSPNDTDAYTHEYYSHMRPGSHHEIIFALGSDVADSTGPDSCDARDQGVLNGSTFIAGATRPVQDAAMFGGAPEDDTIASFTPAHQQLSVNLHFINTTETPLLQEVWVNMINYPHDPSTITEQIKAITWYGGIGMNIPVGATQVVEAGTDGSCTPGYDMRILGLTAHAHASTTRVTTYLQRANSTTKELVFEEYSWDEPTVFRFNSTTTNTPPNPEALIPGSPISGIFRVSPGDKFSWECEVTNNRSVNLTFSDRAYDGEMCNVFGMYSAPDAASPFSCISF